MTMSWISLKYKHKIIKLTINIKRIVRNISNAAIITKDTKKASHNISVRSVCASRGSSWIYLLIVNCNVTQAKTWTSNIVHELAEWHSVGIADTLEN